MLAFRERVRAGHLFPYCWGPHHGKILLVLIIDLLLVLHFTSRSPSHHPRSGGVSAQSSWSSRVLGAFQTSLKAPTTSQDLRWALTEDYKAGRWNYTPSDLEPRERLEFEYPFNEYERYGQTGNAEPREMPKWNSTLLLVELLRMPLGMMIVGDSVSKQHFEGFCNLLGCGSGIVRVSNHVNDVGFFGYLTMHLNPDHPVAKEAIAIAGVASSRLERPIISQSRADWLMSIRDAKEVWGSVVTNQAFPPGPIAYYDWLADLDGPLREATEAAREHGTPVSKTVVVLNTSAHWTSHEFQLDDPGIHDVYAGMIDMTIRKLGALPTKDSISVMYRPTSAAHDRCMSFTTPIPAEEAATREQRVRIYNWHFFSLYNEMWRKAMFSHKTNQPDMLYLNIYEQALSQPDAHRHEGDCLHWCGPSVPEEWTRLVYYLLAVGS